MGVERVYLDLDRTLFNTDYFTSEIFLFCQRRYNISAAVLRAELNRYRHVIYDGSSYYDFFTHLEAHNVKREELRTAIAKELSPKNFALTGAVNLLQFLQQQHYEVVVLSFGAHDFQTCKYNMMSELAAMPLVTVREPKQTYLARQVPKPSVIIDDRRIDNLPTWCVGMQLNPLSKDEVIMKDGYVIVQSLDAAVKFLQNGQSGIK